MIIEKWFTETVTVYEIYQGADSGGSLIEGATSLGTIDCHIYSIRGSEQDIVEKTEGLRFKKMICGIDETISEGNKVTYSGEDYEVIGLVNRNHGNNQHKEVLLKQVI